MNLMNMRIFYTLILLLIGQNAMAIEEPAFNIVLKSEAFEVRQYAPMLVAETLVDGDMDEASTKGFRKIADYIFGNNRANQTGAAAKIAMTAPVTLEPVSEKIAMTAPVTLSTAQQGGDMASANKWRVHFVMPAKYTMTNIPLPNNADVKLREIPGKLFAVHSFTGFNSVARVQTKSDELLAWLQSKNFKPLSSVQLSRYDPPWTLPMFRRNEIMVEIAQ